MREKRGGGGQTGLESSAHLFRFQRQKRPLKREISNCALTNFERVSETGGVRPHQV